MPLLSPIDTHLLEYENYDDYLDSFISNADYRYLRVKRLCRRKVVLNYNPAKLVLTHNEFVAHREFLREQMTPQLQKEFRYSKRIKSFDPVLTQLAMRERPNYQKNLSTIIFLNHRDKNGFEVSGFIDFEASLQQSYFKLPGSTDWLSVYAEKTRLRPKPHDLSYFDKHKNIIRYNTSENYKVEHDATGGLVFEHRGDHKKICVSGRGIARRNYIRTVHFSKIYGYVILFDHIVRKKI